MVTIVLPPLPINRLDSAANIAALRAIPSASLENGQDIAVDGSVSVGDGFGGLFTWSELSTETDDAVTVIKPTDVSPMAAGRWILTGGALSNNIVSNLISTDDGKGVGLVGLDQTATYPDSTLGAYFSKIRNINAGPFNAKGDGTDETARINDWKAEGLLGYELEGGSGTYGTTETLDFGAFDGMTVRMAGSKLSRFMYLGGVASTTLLDIGSASVGTYMDLSGFAVDSAIAMNSSSRTFILRNPHQGSRIFDVKPGSLNPDASANVWHGFLIDRPRQGVTLDLGTFRTNGTAIEVKGDGTTSVGADLAIIGLPVILGGDKAVHLSGGMGGVYIPKMLAYGNNYGLVMDRTGVDRANREVILGGACIFDAQYIAHIYCDQPDGADPADNDRLFITDSAFCSGAGFIDGLPATGVWIKSAPGATWLMNGKFIKSPTEDAILYEDASCKLRGDDGCYIGLTGRDGIRSTVSTNNISWKSELFESITGLRMSDNIRYGTSASMSVAASSGAIGSASATMRYTRPGNFFETSNLRVAVASVGTATGPLLVTMPFTVKDGVAFSGSNETTGAPVGARMLANTNILVINAIGGGIPATTGEVITLTGGGEIYG